MSLLGVTKKYSSSFQLVAAGNIYCIFLFIKIICCPSPLEVTLGGIESQLVDGQKENVCDCNNINDHCGIYCYQSWNEADKMVDTYCTYLLTKVIIKHCSKLPQELQVCKNRTGNISQSQSQSQSQLYHMCATPQK